MSANGDEETDSEDLEFLASHPGIWVLVPIILVTLIASIALFVYARRRSPSPAGMRRALERDLETASRGVPQRHAGSTRWAWISAAVPGRTYGEGLNELGEAPPPYQVVKNGPKVDEAGAELRTLAPRPIGPHAEASVLGSSITPAAEPPAYNNVVRDERSRPIDRGAVAPPAAVLVTG